MYGLNIHIQSICFNKNLFEDNDKVRVSITTFPENYKEAVIVDANKMKYLHNFFEVNITDRTDKIVFVFRKKNIFQNDPIIASTTIKTSDLPSPKHSKNTEMKTINILEPVKNGHQNRKVYGQMEIQFSLTNPFPILSNKHKTRISKINKEQKYSKVNQTSNINENSNQNISIFVDNGVYN